MCIKIERECIGQRSILFCPSIRIHKDLPRNKRRRNKKEERRGKNQEESKTAPGLLTKVKSEPTGRSSNIVVLVALSIKYRVYSVEGCGRARVKKSKPDPRQRK